MTRLCRIEMLVPRTSLIDKMYSQAICLLRNALNNNTHTVCVTIYVYAVLAAVARFIYLHRRGL